MSLEKRLILARWLRISVLVIIAIGLALDYFPDLTGGGIGENMIVGLIVLCFNSCSGSGNLPTAKES